MSSNESLNQRLANGELLILDGATSTELQKRGVPMDEHTWSGTVAVTHPAEVRQLHHDYIEAGADVIIATTYSSSRHILDAAGLGERVREINTQAIELAQQARDQAGKKPVWIAGSISLMAPDFTSAKRPSVAQIGSYFKEQADILTEAGADLIALEMLRDVDYSRVAIELALSTGLPVWAGFSCQYDNNGDLVMASGVGETPPFKDVLDELLVPELSLVSVMHSEIDVTTDGLKLVREKWDDPLGVYPNSGDIKPPNWIFENIISPDEFAKHAKQWRDMGCQIIGGCCGLGPEHIQRLSDEFA